MTNIPHKEKLPSGFKLQYTLQAQPSRITQIAWSPDGNNLAFASIDKTLRLYNPQSEELVRELKGHEAEVYDVAWSLDGHMLASASADRTIKLWDAKTGELKHTLVGHPCSVRTVAWSPDGQWLTSGGEERYIRSWDVQSGQMRQIWNPEVEDNAPSLFSGHSDWINDLSWINDEPGLASASYDMSVKLWDVETGNVRHNLAGHTDWVLKLAWSPNGQLLATASKDKTIVIWDAHTGRQLKVLEGHTESVICVTFSFDGKILASKSLDGSVLLWRTDTCQTIAALDETGAYKNIHAGIEFHPHLPLLATLGEKDTVIRIWELDPHVLLGSSTVGSSTFYVNAKVALVGDTGVGKSGLAYVLANEEFQPTESSHGCHVWPLETQHVELDHNTKEIRETFLWDLAGQPGYRIINQLSLSGITVALVLFDSRSETDPFAGVAYWARALDESRSGVPSIKFLVASRVDRGGPAVSRLRIEEVVQRYGFDGFFETSAKRGNGVLELAEAIRNAIPWDKLPRVSAPEIFREIREFVGEQKEVGRVLARRVELFSHFQVARVGTDVQEDVFHACLSRLESAGMVRELSIGGFILLQPEMLDGYCAWIALAAREEPEGLGFISEQKVLNGQIEMDRDRPLTNNADDERLMLLAAVQEVVQRNIARREETERGVMLVFPSELRADLLKYPGGYSLALALVFEGSVKAIYATLVVRLINSLAFRKKALYNKAALLLNTSNQVCGLAVDYPDPQNDALGRITVFFDKNTERGSKLLFLRYAESHLEGRALKGSIKRERVFESSCGYTIPTEAVNFVRKRGDTTVVCPVCREYIQLDDLSEDSAPREDLVEFINANADSEGERQSRKSIMTEKVRRRESDVFLCHNTEDKPGVRLLVKSLRDQGIYPWLDEDEIGAGVEFIPVLERVLNEIPAALIIIGRHGRGPWQQKEYNALIQRFVEQDKNRGFRKLALIPLLLPTAPGNNELHLPTFLRGINWIDFRNAEGFDNPEALRSLVDAINDAKQ